MYMCTLNISSHSFSPALQYELLPIRDLIAGNLRTVYTGLYRNSVVGIAEHPGMRSAINRG